MTNATPDLINVKWEAINPSWGLEWWFVVPVIKGRNPTNPATAAVVEIRTPMYSPTEDNRYETPAGFTLRETAEHIVAVHNAWVDAAANATDVRTTVLLRLSRGERYDGKAHPRPLPEYYEREHPSQTDWPALAACFLMRDEGLVEPVQHLVGDLADFAITAKGEQALAKAIKERAKAWVETARTAEGSTGLGQEKLD